MFSREAIGLICVLNYHVYLDKSPTRTETIDRALRSYIYDRLSKATPEQRVVLIEEALRSDCDLSKIGPQSPHSDDTLRIYYKGLAEGIRSKRIGFQTILVNGKISDRNRDTLAPLLSMLENDPHLDHVLKRFENEFLCARQNEPPHDEMELAIGYLLRTDYPLAELTDNRFSEADFRQFLLEVAWKIQDHQRIIEADQ